MPNLLEFSKDIENAEHELAVVLQVLVTKYKLPKIEVCVNLQDLRNFSVPMKELYGDLIIEPTTKHHLGVFVTIIAEFVPTHVSHCYRYCWLAWLGYWWFKLKKANPKKPRSFYLDFWEKTFWEIEVPK
jgi:hypothetical protein